MSAGRSLLVVACLCVPLEATAEAHVLDEYLQVAQVTLAPDGSRVELRLTPGVDVADRVFAQIDRDGDGAISPPEEQAYAQSVLHDLSLDVDGHRTALTLASAEFPLRSEMRAGIGSIRLELAADAPLGSAGEHRVTFRNDHLPELGTYLANVLVPATRAIAITGQRRDLLQHELEVRFCVTPEGRPGILWALAFGMGLVLFVKWGNGSPRA